MIEKLTKQQEIDLKETYNEYLKIGRDITPVDFSKAEKDITALYEWGGFKKPAFIHFSSPMICELFINLLCSHSPKLWGQLGDQLRDQLRDQLGGQLRDQLRGQLWDQLGDQLWDQLGDQLGDQLWGQLGDQLRDQLRDQLGGQLRDQLRGQLWGQLRDQLGDQLWDQLGDQLGDQLWGQLGDQLWDQLGGQLWGQLRDQLGDQLWGQLRGQLGDQLWGQLRDQKMSYMGTWFNGQQDSYWVSFYEFGQKIGVNFKNHNSDGLKIWTGITRSCHWFYPFLDFCLISDKPRKLNVDEQGRLHSTTEKALEYSDGWGFCSVHGVIVPNWVIETPNEITTKKIVDESNAEIRRVMLDLFGCDRYLVESGAKLIHQSERGILYRSEIPDDEPLVMVKVTNSTPELDGHFKDYFLRVPPNMRTADEAVAWTFGVKDYAPVAES